MAFKIPKGSDKVPITIRVEDIDFTIIDKISKRSKKSYNFVINKMIKYSIANMEDKEKQELENEE